MTMKYKLMRMRKYYDNYRSNKSFSNSSLKQKYLIVTNILKFMKTNLTKPLIVKNKPIIAQIESTSECNLKCKMCIRKEVGVPIGTMSLENFKIILDKLDSLFKIHLSGQGESLLNPEIFEMIDYANKKGAIVYLVTNGTLLTENIIKRICSVNIGELAISIDSPKKEIYEKIRVGSNFDKVIGNIKNLATELEKNKKKTVLSVSAVILKDNIGDLTEFIELAKNLGIKKLGFQKMQEKDDYLQKYSSAAAEQKVSDHDILFRKKIEEAKRFANENKITLIFDEEKSPGCIWPWRSMYITWNGHVTPCCKILDYREPYFGNILKEDFWKIWNGKEFQMFRGLLRKRNAPSPCKGCSVL